MTVQLLAGLVLSSVVGVSLGVIGGGGSIITVPVLVYVLGVEAHQAVAMSLAVVGATSVIGTALHYRNGNVVLKTGALFGGAGVIGAYLGSHLTYLVSQRALLLAFAGLMLAIGVLMLARRQRSHDDNDPPAINPQKIFGAGLCLGILTGFLGVGGGFLIVPALLMFGGLRMQEAVGTSLFIISINCAAALAGHLSHGGFSVITAMLVTLSAAIGMFAGTGLSRKASAARLQNAFAVFLIAMSVILIANNCVVFANRVGR
jgi:uncharacterized membrane protein YfcA